MQISPALPLLFETQYSQQITELSEKFLTKTSRSITTNFFLTPKVIASLFLCFKKWSWLMQYNDKTELCVPRNLSVFPRTESRVCQF